MPNVLIRDLDPDVHAVLAERAKGAGQSLQQFLTAELTRLASKPTNAEIIARIRARDHKPSFSPEDVIAALHRERRRG
ncbi:MAG: antitoxin [Microbacterium sp.]|uniref:FitA-like ribbon-helix-helix domain-containing protein n=1 Tax=Microbacterium sp. TaxID=51671 RepID=UPI0039E3B737